MDSDSWSRISSAFSKRSQSRSDVYHGEDCEGEDEARPEYLCPFCAEDFDMVGLCCHVDEEHAVEAKNGVCPVCAKKVGSDLVRHMTVQHGALLKVQRRRRLRKGGSNLSSMLKKELRDGQLLSILNGSSYPVSSSQTDPLLASFINNSHAVSDQLSSPSPAQSVASLVSEESTENFTDIGISKPSPLSDEDLIEKARRSEFVQGLLVSTFLDDYL